MLPPKSGLTEILALRAVDPNSIELKYTPRNNFAKLAATRLAPMALLTSNELYSSPQGEFEKTNAAMNRNGKRKQYSSHDSLELDLGAPTKRARESNLSDTISFRINTDLFELLEQRAAFQGMSYHKYARALVIESLLRDASEQCVSSFLEKLDSNTSGLRDDIAFFMKTIHMTIGRLSEKEADEWVKRNFKR